MADVSSAQANLIEHARQLTETAIDTTTRETVEASPKGSGRLAASIDHGSVTQRGFTFATYIIADEDHALWADDGTRPHPIDPVNARVLAWQGPGGDWIRASHVDHPGTEGSGFFRRAMPGRWHDALAGAVT